MRKFTGLALATTVLAGLLVAMPLTSASALSEGVDFSADDLSTWQTDNTAWAIGATKGVVIAGGSFTTIRPPDSQGGAARPQAALAIFDAATGAPTNCQFTVAMPSASPSVRSIAVSPDGNSVYIAGNFTSVNGVSMQRVAKIDPIACTLDTNFKVASPSAIVWGVTATNSAVYLAGQFTSLGSTTRNRFAAVNPATGATLDWNPNANGIGRAVQVSPDGTRVAIGGEFTALAGADNAYSFAIVDAVSGAPVRTWPKSFIISDAQAGQISELGIPVTSWTHVFASNSTTLFVGNEGTGGHVFDGRFAIDWNSYDQVWRDGCFGATQALAVYNNALYAGHHTHDCTDLGTYQDGSRHYFTAQSTTTGEQFGWFPQANDGWGEGIGPRALTVATASNGAKYLWAAGEFTRINGVLQNGLTRFGTTDSGTIPTPVATATSAVAGQVRISFRTVVDEDDDVLTYKVYRDSSATPFWTGTAKSLWWTRPGVTVVDSGVAPGTTHTYRVTAEDSVRVSPLSTRVSVTVATTSNAYAAAVLADSPQTFWRYDTTNTIVDDSAGPSTTGRVGQLMDGATTTSTGAIAGSGSATFDGSNDYMWDDKYETRPDVFTVESWINTTTTSGGKIIGFGNGRPRTDNSQQVGSGNYDNHVYMDNSGRLTFGVYKGGTQTIRTSKSYNDGQWHHVAATMDGTGMKFYVDGVLVGRNGTTSGDSYKGVWRVGGDSIGGWPNQPSSSFFAGSIDETAIYDKALNAQQVAAHYTAGGGTPDVNTVPSDSYGAAVFNDDPNLFWRLNETSGSVAADSTFAKANPGTVGPQVQMGRTGAVQNSSAFETNGSQNSTVTSPQAGRVGAFAAELWFSSTTNRGGKLIGWENQPTGSSSGYDKQVYLSNDGRLTFGVYNGSVQAIQTPRSYNDGAWHHVVATQDAQGMRFYVDGILIGTNPTTQSETFSGYWRIGGGNISGWPNRPSSDYVSAKFDEVAVYSQSLTAEQVARHYAIGVSDVAAPSGVAPLSATVADGTVSLAWTAATDDHAIAGYRVYRGSSADFTADASTLIGQTTTELVYADTPATLGTYYYKVLAVDAAGNAGPAASAEAVVTDTSAPAVPAGVTAAAGTTSVNLAWTASADNVATTGYTVYRGSSSDFVADASTVIAQTTTASYLDGSLAPGTYYYRVTASDAAGNVSAASSTVSAEIVADTTAPTVPANLTATAGTSSVNLAWSASNDTFGTTGYTVYRGSSSSFVADQSTVIAQTATTGYVDSGLAPGTYYYRVTASDAAGNVSASSSAVSAQIQQPAVEPVTVTLSPTSDTMVAQVNANGVYGTTNQLSARGTTPIESYLAFTLPSAPAGTTLTGASLRLRTSSDATSASTDAQNVRLLTGSWSDDSTWNTRPTGLGAQIGSIAGVPAMNTTYNVALDATALRSLTGSTSIALTATGSDNSRFWSNEQTNAAYRPQLTLTYSPTTTTPPVADTTAPTVPAGLTGVAGATSAALSWTASTDATGVTGYSVYRGTTAGFTADSSSKIADVTGTTYTDQGLALGTYFYKVDAVDAAGNRSAASAASSVTIAAPAAEPVIVTLSPSQDTMAAQVNPNNPYGATNQLSSRGGSSAIESYLDFALPATPAGTTLTKATLQLRSSSDATATSTEAQVVRSLTGSWSEATTTWTNRPTGVGAELGRFNSVPALNTNYTADLNPAGLATSGTVSLALTGTGTDNARFWSKEQTNAAFRPVLTLTYTPTSGTTPTPVADTTAPTVPASVAASASGQNVSVSWAAASDAVGVTSYAVYRGTTSDFAADGSSKIADVNGTSYTDSARPAGTWFYRVDAADAAGNRSAASGSASATVAATPPATGGQTVTVQVSEDSMVAAVNANNPYGLTNQISSRGPASGSAIESYLKVALPAAPAGTTLTGATLQVRTSDDASAASADEHVVSLLSGDWAENTVTWTNRPTGIGVRLGALTGATALNTNYTVQLDAAALQGLLGTTASFALTSTGTDNVRLWSNNAANAAYRPTLVLTFG
ncbi:DNRLRE domain-containing protein [Amnibacterium flavum]|uniref:Fibronectin type-III domain-containing protein n=1 Tax=Amnibacterium flavum TaxID=2173173 RepID=A0A2V1HXA5_9MICO|nr:LamG-like jellyroll fold domain-containing protein [Amnibacterium flavum]PVZ95890.1 hypothetical protein DDQ50_05340 [Amnibacterium flavum]